MNVLFLAPTLLTATLALLAQPISRVEFEARPQPLTPVAARGIALCDFNGDGKLDAFIVADNTADSQGLRVCWGDGHGGFTDSGQNLPYPSPFTHRPAVADVDRDGDGDVVVGGTLWPNDGHGIFTRSGDFLEGTAPDLTAVGLADVDGDGAPDLVAIERWKTLRVFLNDGHGHFRREGFRLGLGAESESPILATFATGDVDGDGHVDLVTVGWRNASTEACPNRVWLGDGRGSFRDSGRALDEGRHHVHGLALGDLDGDGRPDLVLALTERDQACKVYLNTGGGAFRATDRMLGDAWAHAAVLGDFDGDGATDVFLVCGDPKQGTPNQVLLNDGHGVLTDSGLRLAHAFSWDGAAADLDGDGRTDVFVANLRLVDDTKMPPTFGGAVPEVWLNRTTGAADRNVALRPSGDSR